MLVLVLASSASAAAFHCDQLCAASSFLRTAHRVPRICLLELATGNPAELDSATASVGSAQDALSTHGVVRLNGVLPPPAATSLRSYVDSALEAALQSARESVALDMGDVMIEHFGEVLVRENRHDLKLDLGSPPVKAAVDALLSSLAPILAACLGEDAVLYELAALISDPQAPSQPFHPDTPHLGEAQGLAVLTAFVALQPIGKNMGPTNFLPSSHTAEAHAVFNRADDGGEAKLALLRSRPTWRGLLGTGDCSLFDSRLLHCGGPNTSDRRRVIFYLSFKAKNAKAPPGTLLYELRGKHSLADLRPS